MSSDENYKKRQFLERELQEISKKKLKILWAIFVSILGPFLLPFFPMKKSINFATEIGYWNSVILFSVALLITMPYLIYKEYDNIKRTQHDIERELKNLFKNSILISTFRKEDMERLKIELKKRLGSISNPVI